MRPLEALLIFLAFAGGLSALVWLMCKARGDDWAETSRRWNERDAVKRAEDDLAAEVRRALHPEVYGDFPALPTVEAPPADNAAPGSGLGRLNRAGRGGIFGSSHDQGA